VPDIWLQAIEGEDDPALIRQHPSQPSPAGQRRGEQLVIAVEQVGPAALGDVHPALAQDGMDLRRAAVLAVAQPPNQGNGGQTKRVPRQRQGTFRLRAVGDVKARTVRRLAAADPQPQPHRARQGHQSAAVLIAKAQMAAAPRARLPGRTQNPLPLRPGPRQRPAHLAPPEVIGARLSTHQPANLADLVG
jgi:hypothetical protein